MSSTGHLETVRDLSDPIGRAAADWAGALSDRAGETVPYAFALALARRCGAPATRPLVVAPGRRARPA